MAIETLRNGERSGGGPPPPIMTIGEPFPYDIDVVEEEKRVALQIEEVFALEIIVRAKVNKPRRRLAEK